MWFMPILNWLVSNWRETLLGALILFLVSSNAIYKNEAHDYEAKYTESQAQVSILGKQLSIQNASILQRAADQKQVKTQVTAAVTANKAIAAKTQAAVKQATPPATTGVTCKSAMDYLRDSPPSQP